MAMTPRTSATAYCTGTQLLDYCDWRIVADSLRDDDGPRPSRAAILDATTETGARLVALCLAGSGDLEAACLARGLYAPADLAVLTGAGLAHLKRVAAGLTLLVLFARRYPGTGKPDELPAVAFAREAVERLRLGERVFATDENAAAGAGMEAVTFVNTDGDARLTTRAASRFFGARARD